MALIFSLSFGSMPISRIHGFANSSGEYHKNPIGMVAMAATRIASKFRWCMCMEGLQYLRNLGEEHGAANPTLECPRDAKKVMGRHTSRSPALAINSVIT